VQGLDRWFHDIDYPLLFWLSKLVVPGNQILELGGSIGHFFYTSERFHRYPNDISWTIAELPEAVRLGSKIAQQRNEQRLHFIDSSHIDAAPACQIFLTAGTLQYMTSTLPELLQRLPALPAHVLVHNLPCHKNEAFWTLQNLGVCELPYYIYNLQALKAEMASLGYQLTAEWKNPRYIEIPFQRHMAVEGYLGFYFQRVPGGGL
jgi:putative methyltransferase (TIGR04325 family)